MATYGYSYTNTCVTIEVYGLSVGDSVRFFVRYEPNPGTMLVNGEAFIATSSTMAKSFFVLSAGKSYAINVYVNGIVLGTRYFDTSSGQNVQIRPNNWYWSGIYSGAAVILQAQTWNQFCARINEFRRYKGLSNYSFTTVYSGNPMYAWQVNEAIIAINSINGHGSTPTYVYSGNPMDANFMIQLQNALNAIQ